MRSEVVRITAKRLGLVLSSVVMAVAGSPAAGQFGGRMGGDDAFSPPVSSRELDEYAKVLGMSEDQAEAAKVLFDGYMEQFQAESGVARDKSRRLMEEARDFQDFSKWREIRDLRTGFSKRSQEMETAFFDDIQMLLDDTQMQRWPALERTRRRLDTIGRGLMSGERVDVIRLVEETELTEDQRSPIESILEQYAMDLDRELTKRNQVYDEAQNYFGSLEGRPDPTELQDLMDRGRAAAIRVRDINERYARQVASALPEEARAGFEDRVKRLSYPQVYRETRAQQTIAGALGLEDLTDDQRTQIEAIRDSYSRDLTASNDRMVRATREMEETMTVRDMFNRGGGDRGPMGDLMRERRDLETSVLQRVRGLLTDAQVEQLPRRNEDDRRGGGGGPPRGGQRGGGRGAPREL